MNFTDITERLDVIKSLPICELDKRQPLLVSLLADLVNSETTDGEGTTRDPLESQDWWQTLSCLIEDAGFTMLGNGHFSAAYSHPLLPKRVIKVGFKKEDSGAAYVAFCRMHQGKAGIPNIYDVQRHSGCYTVVLDELFECEPYENGTHEYYKNLACDFIEYGGDYVLENEEDREFVDVCKEIRKFFNGIASFDMHSGNIMFDEHDRPFITDPVSFSKKSEEIDCKPFSLDPEELLKEIEVMAEQNRLAKAIERHERKLGLKEFRKGRKAWRKRKAKAYEQHKEDMRVACLVKNERERNENAARIHVGESFLQNMFFANPFHVFDEAQRGIVARVREADRVAMVQGRDLMIDKVLDKCLMG